MRAVTAAVAGPIALATAPLAHAYGNTAKIIAQVYTQVQRGCTPFEPPNFQHIVWDSYPDQFGNEHYPTAGGGTGRIIDADPHLGGPFQVWWNIGPNPPIGYRSVTAQPNG